MYGERTYTIKLIGRYIRLYIYSMLIVVLFVQLKSVLEVICEHESEKTTYFGCTLKIISRGKEIGNNFYLWLVNWNNSRVQSETGINEIQKRQTIESY